MALAGPALYALPGLAAVLGGVAVVSFGALLVAVEGQLIHGAEHSGDIYLLRAAVHTVFAGGAGNGGQVFEHLHHLRHNLLFAFVEGLEALHIVEVIVHLGLIAHAREHGYKPLKGRAIAYRPGRHGGVGVCLFEYLLYLRGHGSQGPALDRLHDNDGLAVLPRHLIALAGLYAVAVPVGVVYLELNELGFGVL